MADSLFVEKLKAALVQQSKQSTKVRWNKLISRGAIDPSGKVLVRGPQITGKSAASKVVRSKKGK